VTPRHLEVWFGLNPREQPRASRFVARVRWDGVGEVHDARFMFTGGWARPGEMVHALVWFRARDEALVGVVPKLRFDVLDAGRVIATGEVLSR